jgi:NAD(P)-dependent dehydrogenase (short-subunit alcohol dehydrogenase family)
MPEVSFDLTGRVALITGGASGIGQAIAAAFIRHGAKAVVGSRTLQKVEDAVVELCELGKTDDTPAATGVSLDVTDDDSIDAAVKTCIDQYGRLDILVNSAGILIKKPTFDLTRDDFNNVYNTNVTGSLKCAQAAGHFFREQHSGAIINIASVSSFVDLTEVAAYAASKNAVLGLTRSLANEWARYGIRTNAIAPGFIPTDINRKMIEGTDRGRRIIEHTPMERFGVADEIAGCAVFLASDAGSFTNGALIPVDGGYLASGISDAVAPWTQPD